MKKIKTPLCAQCGEEMITTDDSLKCSSCEEEQPFAYQVLVEVQKPTVKQTNYVKRIIDRMGEKFVLEYLRSKYPDATLETMNKEQAQKIINGNGHRTAKPIYNVAGRDVPWR